MKNKSATQYINDNDGIFKRIKSRCYDNGRFISSIAIKKGKSKIKVKEILSYLL